MRGYFYIFFINCLPGVYRYYLPFVNAHLNLLMIQDDAIQIPTYQYLTWQRCYFMLYIIIYIHNYTLIYSIYHIYTWLVVWNIFYFPIYWK